jgi:hypothetical protein
MTSAPLLNDRQWRKIEAHLPPKRRNRDVISGLLFRRWSGAGLRPTAAWYGVTFGRLQSWETQLRAGGQLQTIMRELKLPEASPTMFSNGGTASNWREDDTSHKVTDYRFGRFKDALRRR